MKLKLPKPRKSSATSQRFAVLVAYCRSKGYPVPVAEHKFHPVRKWRFDFCWPERMLAGELHGGVYTQGRHTQGVGFSNDCEKMSAAAILRWRVIPVTTQQFDKGMLWDLLDQEFGRGLDRFGSNEQTDTP